MSALSGRAERELKSEEIMSDKLDFMPRIFYEFYQSLYNKSYRTKESYIDYVYKFAQYVCGDTMVYNKFYTTVTPVIINQYFSRMKYTTKNGKVYKVSDSFRATNWSALNTFFTFLVKNNKLKVNPMTQTERPTINDNPEVSYLTEDEIHKLLDHIEQTSSPKFRNRDLAIVSLGVSTGIRVSALSQINVQDVDFDSNTISVIEKREKKCVIMFGDTVKQYLEKWLVDREKYFGNVDTDALFLSNQSQRLSIYGIGVMLKRYSKDITNKNVTPHVMRHSCATNLYDKTGDIYLCASVLNHKNVATTQRYAEISQNKKKEAANILDKLL